MLYIGMQKVGFENEKGMDSAHVGGNCFGVDVRAEGNHLKRDTMRFPG